MVILCQPGGWSTCGYLVSARWLEYMWLLCVGRVAGVYVVIECQPDGWSICGYCVSVGWLVLQGIFFPMLMEADCSLMIIFHTNES